MSLEGGVLLRMATARDAAMTRDVLARAELTSHTCADTTEMLAHLDRSPDALLVAEEALAGTALAALAEALGRQEPWSDLPVVVLSRPGANSPGLDGIIARLPNVTVLERPVRMASLLTVVRSVLRARSRQYELRTVLADLQLADRRKTEFLATLAHELRNPLAPISTSLAILSLRNVDPAAKPHHDMIGRQVRYMTRLIDDLMEVSRITRGRVGLQRMPVDLNDLIVGAVEISRPLVDAAGHQLRIEKSPETLIVDGDATRLTQVLANLVNNAAKYTPPGGTITIRSQREEAQAIVQVIDNGAGLEPAMLQSVFDMFVQVTGTARAAQGGLGIGLTLAKSLVDLHGGSITADSAGLGRGSTFIIRLPLTAEPAGNGALAGSVKFDDARSLASKQVLVVDDNRDAADSLSALLGVVGAATATAYDGEAAAALASKRDFDAIVLDIGMPGTDGCDVARRLLATCGSHRPMLIALTGWGQEADRTRIAEAGFDHHLLKPVDLDRLLAIMSNAPPGHDAAG